jgi:hypothetical protein
MEGMGPMALKGFLKKWVEHLGKAGTDASVDVFKEVSSEHYDKARHMTDGISAKRLGTKAVALDLFNDLSPDLQSWAMQHWNNEEYFSEVFANINLGLVIEFIARTASGLKYGTLNFWRTSGATLDSSENYLLSNRKNLRRVFLQDRGWRLIKDSPERWVDACLDDINSKDSVLVHEFQHWFQESVYYGNTGLKGKRLKKQPRNIMSPKKMVFPFIKAIFAGVDFSKKFKYAGTDAFKINDIAAFADSLALKDSTKDYQTPRHQIAPLEQYFGAKATTATSQINRLFDLSKEDWRNLNDSTNTWNSRIGSDSKPQRDILWKTQRPTTKGLKHTMHELNQEVEVSIIKGNLGKNVQVSDSGNIQGKLIKVSDKNKDHKKLLFVVFHKVKISQASFTNSQNKMFPSKWGDPWIKKPEEYDAESRNYMAGIVQSLVISEKSFQIDLLKGNETRMKSRISEDLERKLRYRFDRKLHAEKWPEVKNIISRLANRMIEQAELHSAEDLVPNEDPIGLANFVKKGSYYSGNYFKELWKRIEGSVG